LRELRLQNDFATAGFPWQDGKVRAVAESFLQGNAGASVNALIIVLLVIITLALVLGLWLLLGRGPRRQRAFRHAQRVLEQGEWNEALAVVTAIQGEARLSAVWQDRLRAVAGECHQRGADHALKEKRFEDALQHALEAGARLGLDQGEQRNRVVEAMLAELRRLFASGAETQAVTALLDRIFAVQSLCAEASFWQALCLVRQERIDKAIAALTTAHEQVGKQVLDPAFYLGVLLHRQGKVQESLRFLAEANRVDAGCPFVTGQMGVSLVAAGGDSGLALRALQRALGPRGFGLWAARPERAWVEAFPESRSFVRRLANKYPYVCPVFGPDLTVILRQGQFALAQAHYRHGDFQEAADLFGKLLQDSPPTVPLLRGLGLALARAGRHDQAYKHLRIALEQEDPKDPFTAGYLGLCGALGKPTQPEDKPRNVTWAIRLLARYPVFENVEWAGLISAVHAEARALDMPLGVDEQLQLCDVLASVHATDPQAADAYAHLARTFPDAVRPKHAFLYVRAATVHGCTSEVDLDLFGRTFAESGAARAYFAEHEWNFEDAEYTFLERSAARQPGQFPGVLGVDYPARGESFLLERSRREEESGHKDPARSCMEVLLRLAPSSVSAHDRLACLHYRRGDVDRAVALLTSWQRLTPTDHWPLVRQAIIEQERGNAERRAEAIDRALGLTQGRLRGGIAFLGARLALRETVRTWEKARKQEVETRRSRAESNGDTKIDTPEPAAVPSLSLSQSLLEACLRDDPDHVEALWCLAAVRSVRNDSVGLAAQAPAMNRPAVTDARFHYLGAVCHLAAKDYGTAIELSQRAAADESLAIESQFLMAWAHLHQSNAAAAQQALTKVAGVEKSPSAPYARALLGRLSYERGAYDEAIKWWNSVEPRKRTDWQFDDALRQTVLLSGLLAYEKERFEQAADRFREAGKLGLRDRRLGPLITLALVRAGQRLLYSEF
jgi:tetratricopeptide (TPR) repeat protein